MKEIIVKPKKMIPSKKYTFRI